MKYIIPFSLALFFSLPAIAQPFEGGSSERLSLMEEQLRELTGKIEQLEFEQRKLSEKLEKLGTAPAAIEPKAIPSKAEADPTPIVPEAAEPKSKKEAAEKPKSGKPAADGTKTLGTIPAEKVSDIATSEGIDAEYETAFSLLREEQYDDAIEAFNAFAEQHSENPLTGAALYWIGEAYYAQKEYQQASIQFLKSYQKFPKGQKAPDSLLKLALSLGELKKTKEACTTTAKLEAEFPKMPSSIRKRADTLKKTLACK